MEKFYRVNGGSTQLKGVVPDILLPDALDYLDDEDMGERRNKAALPYDEIPAAPINSSNKVVNINQLATLSKSRLKANPVFQLVEQTAEIRKKKMEDRTAPMNEKELRNEQEEVNALNKKMDEITKKANTLEVVNIKADISRINIDSTSINKNKDWLKGVSKDVYIAETINILNDLSKATMKVNVGTGMK
jgi:carboxyl-terminal processing protease